LIKYCKGKHVTQDLLLDTNRATESSTNLYHFSRYLLQSKGKEKTAEFFIKYEEALEKLHEMAEILINKRLIC